jgi:hypothetical protein
MHAFVFGICSIQFKYVLFYFSFGFCFFSFPSVPVCCRFSVSAAPGCPSPPIAHVQTIALHLHPCWLDPAISTACFIWRSTSYAILIFYLHSFLPLVFTFFRLFFMFPRINALQTLFCTTHMLFCLILSVSLFLSLICQFSCIFIFIFSFIHSFLFIFYFFCYRECQCQATAATRQGVSPARRAPSQTRATIGRRTAARRTTTPGTHLFPEISILFLSRNLAFSKRTAARRTTMPGTQLFLKFSSSFFCFCWCALCLEEKNFLVLSRIYIYIPGPKVIYIHIYIYTYGL